jgi:hypothetical protein
MKRWVKIMLALGAGTALAVVAFLLFALRGGEIERGTHLAHVSWLPVEATDVTYAKREGFGWITCYECRLPKEAFDRFAQKQGWTLEPKSDVTTGFRLFLFPSPPGKNAERDGLITVDLSHEPRANDLVSRALFYEKRFPNSGGTTVIYDLEKERLFVNESHR